MSMDSCADVRLAVAATELAELPGAVDVMVKMIPGEEFERRAAELLRRDEGAGGVS